MKLYSLSVLAGMLVFAVLFPVRQATACTPLPTQIEWSIPANNATGVPTNAAIVLGSNAASWKPPATLKNDKGEEVKLTASYAGSVFMYVPDTPLTANTKYTLTCEECFREMPDQSNLTFTTGDKEDSTTGTYPGAKAVTYKFLAAVTKPAGPCDSIRPERFAFDVTGPTQTGAIFYELTLEGTGPIARAKEPTFSHQMQVKDQDNKETCFLINAYFPNGKSDGNTTKVCVTPQKQTVTESTEETGAQPDGGTTSDGNTQPQAGCGCNQTPGHSSWLVLLSVFFLLWLPTRR
jgi:hypothetical protein